MKTELLQRQRGWRGRCVPTPAEKGFAMCCLIDRAGYGLSEKGFFQGVSPDREVILPELPPTARYGNQFPEETARSFHMHCPDCGAALYRSGGCPVCDDGILLSPR